MLDSRRKNFTDNMEGHIGVAGGLSDVITKSWFMSWDWEYDWGKVHCFVRHYHSHGYEQPLLSTGLMKTQKDSHRKIDRNPSSTLFLFIGLCTFRDCRKLFAVSRILKLFDLGDVF